MNLIKQNSWATHFEKQNSKFIFEKRRIPNPARIPPQTPPAGGKSAEAGQIQNPRKIVCPAESASFPFHSLSFRSKKVRANAKITPPFNSPSMNSGSLMVLHYIVRGLILVNDAPPKISFRSIFK